MYVSPVDRMLCPSAVNVRRRCVWVWVGTWKSLNLIAHNRAEIGEFVSYGRSGACHGYVSRSWANKLLHNSGGGSDGRGGWMGSTLHANFTNNLHLAYRRWGRLVVVIRTNILRNRQLPNTGTLPNRWYYQRQPFCIIIIRSHRFLLRARAYILVRLC